MKKAAHDHTIAPFEVAVCAIRLEALDYCEMSVDPTPATRSILTVLKAGETS